MKVKTNQTYVSFRLYQFLHLLNIGLEIDKLTMELLEGDRTFETSITLVHFSRGFWCLSNRNDDASSFFLLRASDLLGSWKWSLQACTFASMEQRVGHGRDES